MLIEMTGRTALLVGNGGAVEAALRRVLGASGATVASAADMAEAARQRDMDRLVVFSPPTPADDIVAHAIAFGEILGPRAGRIVVITSAQGLVAVGSDYAAARDASAAIAAMRTLAMALAERGICVNALAVAAVGADEASLVSHTALVRPGTPEEAAAAALFLLDRENTYMTGHTLAADGGWSAGYIRNF